MHGNREVNHNLNIQKVSCDPALVTFLLIPAPPPSSISDEVFSNKKAISQLQRTLKNIFHFKMYSQEEKVNYALSEGEDRVTDLTTLIRMTGCTGMYWAATGLQVGCTEL